MLIHIYNPKARLMDYSARWYSPNYGRFITEDTFFGWIDEPLSLNRYSYVMNNPVNFIDPTGHQAEAGAGGVNGSTGNTNTTTVDLIVNGEKQGEVTLSDGYTYLEDGSSVRDTFEDWGGTVIWDSDTQSVIVTFPEEDEGSSGSGSSGSRNNDHDTHTPTVQEILAQRSNNFNNSSGGMPSNSDINITITNDVLTNDINQLKKDYEKIEEYTRIIKSENSSMSEKLRVAPKLLLVNMKYRYNYAWIDMGIKAELEGLASYDERWSINSI
ncbi:RHS repeat-associated core domain-containing protein [Tepidibacillus infernus]|uniref:RHS repeat-associated core domain-containing protein n=1 Tax=Tepidibacillus infernus TaxID=1806172 RepID=UPI003B748E0A